MADQLQGNGRQAKAICTARIAAYGGSTTCHPYSRKLNCIVNSRFHLKPLAPVLDGPPRVLVALVDRTKARIFELEDDRLTEKQDFFNDLPRKGKSDGFAGLRCRARRASRAQ